MFIYSHYNSDVHVIKDHVSEPRVCCTIVIIILVLVL